MKKTKKLFVMSLVLMVVMACAATVSAKTFSQSGKKRGVANYSTSQDGDKGTFWAVGTSTKAYTTVTNKTNSTYYMTAATSEYTYDKGITQIAEDKKNVGVGLQVVSGEITRKYAAWTVDYRHSGNIYVSQGANPKYDDFYYIGRQYY